jgi:Na+/H+-dicarboxylate symporter
LGGYIDFQANNILGDKPMKKIPQTLLILICMVIGIVIGAIVNTQVTDPDQIKEIAKNIAVFSDVFLTLIKMIIAPLVFSTLVVGIAHMGDASSVGRIFFKSLVIFTDVIYIISYIFFFLN